MKLNPKSKVGIKIKLAFLDIKLRKAHETGNEIEVIQIEKEIEEIRQPIKQKKPNVSNDVKERMEWIDK